MAARKYHIEPNMVLHHTCIDLIADFNIALMRSRWTRVVENYFSYMYQVKANLLHPVCINFLIESEKHVYKKSKTNFESSFEENEIELCWFRKCFPGGNVQIFSSSSKLVLRLFSRPKFRGLALYLATFKANLSK